MHTSTPSSLHARTAAPVLPQPGHEAWSVGDLAAPASRVHPDLALLRRAFAPARPADATLERLRTHGLVLRHEIGAFDLPGPAQPVPAWWLLRRGRMALGWQAEPGQFVERQLIGPGDWLDVAGALSSPPAWVDAAQCRTPVELLALPLRSLFDACAEDPALMRAVGELLAGRVRHLSDTLHDVVTADVPARLARWLLRRVEGAVAGGLAAPRLVLTELKQAIAAQLGTTSETFSRALRRLADAGVVQVRGYELTLLDLPALQAIAYPDGSGGRARQSFAGARRRPLAAA
ncbi:MAG: Crp/Fnr family transcriptional regulator [Burkholderiaceae bacterium]|nr:Crp/Fnr family transcriptional regulator [Burkholderiaceae bacterium]